MSCVVRHSRGVVHVRSEICQAVGRLRDCSYRPQPGSRQHCLRWGAPPGLECTPPDQLLYTGRSSRGPAGCRLCMRPVRWPQPHKLLLRHRTTFHTFEGGSQSCCPGQPSLPGRGCSRLRRRCPLQLSSCGLGTADRPGQSIANRPHTTLWGGQNEDGVRQMMMGWSGLGRQHRLPA